MWKVSDIKFEDMRPPAELHGRQAAAIACWRVISGMGDPGLALAYAYAATPYLDAEMLRLKSNPRATAEEIDHARLGYNITAVAFAWNNLPKLARAADRHYIWYPELWKPLEANIHAYLEILMAKRWKNYLDWVFSHPGFRSRFSWHFNAYQMLRFPQRPIEESAMANVIKDKIDRMPAIYVTGKMGT